MKFLHHLSLFLVPVITVSAQAATPSFSSFNTSQFSVNGSTISGKNGDVRTNFGTYGLLSLWRSDGDAFTVANHGNAVNISLNGLSPRDGDYVLAAQSNLWLYGNWEQFTGGPGVGFLITPTNILFPTNAEFRAGIRFADGSTQTSAGASTNNSLASTNPAAFGRMTLRGTNQAMASLPFLSLAVNTFDGVGNRIQIDTVNGSDVNGSFVAGRRARGNSSALVAPTSNDVLLAIAGYGWNGTDATNNANALIALKAETNYTAQNQPSFIQFLTTPRGSTTAVERARINANGTFEVSTNLTLQYLGASLVGLVMDANRNVTSSVNLTAWANVSTSAFQRVQSPTIFGTNNITGNATNFTVSLFREWTTNIYTRINATNNINFSNATNTGVATVMINPNGANRIITFPTNWVWLETNLFTLSGSFYTYTITNGGSPVGRRAILSVQSDDQTSNPTNVLALFRVSAQ
jgi:hypothetical protein